MNRIEELFQNKKQNILSVYFTAGFPGVNDTLPVIQLLEKSGADMIEIGIPFSDPLADGPVIQSSSTRALQNGMNLHLLMKQLKNIRDSIKIPLVLMGYLNPVLQNGIESFFKDVEQCGIDGLIIPDLPLLKDLQGFKNLEGLTDLFKKSNLKNILLVTPRTDEARIKKIDSLSGGFIYAVSSSSTTGNQQSGLLQQEDYFRRLQKMNLKNPLLIGFGISGREQFQHACKFASGAIIGSAFIRHIEQNTDLEKSIPQFISSIIN